MNWKHEQSIYHANINVNLMEKDVIQINSVITIHVDVNVKNVCEKDYVWNPARCNCENEYLASFMDDSVIMGADADDEAKSYDETSFNEKKGTCKTQDFYVLLAFLLITITLLIAVSIHC